MACVALSACPARTKRKVGNPALVLPTDGDAQARGRFENSRSRFERDASAANSESFEAIVRDFPEDPIVPHALLYGAMANLRASDAVAALEKLDTLREMQISDPLLASRASLFRGLALASLQRHSEAIVHLRAGRDAINLQDERGLGFWHAAMAQGALSADDLTTALVHLDAWHHVALGAERIYALNALRELVPRIPDVQLPSVLPKLEHSKGAGMALAGRRWVVVLKGRGTRDAQLEAKVQGARAALGESAGVLNSARGSKGLIGALLPISGRLNRVGERTMRGLVLASSRFPGAPLGATMMSPFELVMRDTSSGVATVADSVEDLAQQDVIAVIGPFDSQASGEAARIAGSLGLPLLSLTPRGKAGPGVFAIRHSAEFRAKSLARHAFDKGVRDFAIFAPQTSYGSVVGAAFQAEVARLGGSVVVTATYARGTTSFKSAIKQLRKPWSAVFVPDLAKNLALIAPALAAANFHAMPRGKKSKHGRSMFLLSTAEGIERGFLRSAGRYSEGAVFAPGYFSDRTDSRIAEFVSRYESQFGREPAALEAYGFDAAAVVRFAVDAGASTRGQLQSALSGQSVEGLTGQIRFNEVGERADPGLLFEVKESVSGQYELRARR